MAKRIGGQLAGAFGITLGIGGVTAAITGLVALAKASADYADSIGKAAQITGTSTEALSAWRYGAQLANVSTEELETAITRYSRQIAAAGEGNKEATANFAALGISIRNSTGDLKSTEELLGDLAERFERMPDSAQKTNAAMELLGRSGARLIPLLNGGRENIKAFTDEAQRMGLIVSADAARAAEQFNDNLLRLTKQVQGLKLAIGNNLIPVLVRLLDLFGQLGGVKLEGFDQRALERQIATLKELQRSATPGTRGFEFYAKAIADAEGKLKALNDSQKKVATTKTPPITISTNAAKVKNEVDNFLDGLSKQLADLENKKIELKFGEAAGLGASLDAQFERFKDNLRDKQLPIPKGLGEFFKSLKDRILTANDELRRMQSELQKLDELGKAFSQDSAEFLTVSDDLANVNKQRDAIRKQLEEMRQDLKLGAMDTSTPEAQNRQRIASIEVEFVRTANRITELGQAAGLTQEQIAEDIALAWKKALREIGTAADETAAQWADAFEGTSLAIVDALNDIGTGRDIREVGLNLARRISDALTSALVTKPIEAWIKQQADAIAQGQGGGIFGNILESLGLGGAAKEQELVSEEGSAAAIAAIEATTATSQTSLQAFTQLAQTGLMTEQNLALASIEAVKVAAIAAIQAAAASSGGSPGGLPGMSGGGFDFMSLFGGGASSGGADIFAGGGASFAEQGAGGIGSALMFHKGGEIGPRLQLRRLHAGGGLRPDERMVIAQTGEFMMNRMAVSKIGRDAMNIMNTTGRMPGGESSGGGPVYITQNFPNAQDPEGFRRSKPTYLADLGRAVQKARKHL